MTIKELINYVGTPYQQLDSNGKALGCLLPFYLLNPDAPRFDWPPSNVSFNEYVLNHLKRRCLPVQYTDKQCGDIVIIYMPFGYIHFGIYIGSNKIIHCMTDDAMEIYDLSHTGRRKEVYRWAL